MLEYHEYNFFLTAAESNLKKCRQFIWSKIQYIEDYFVATFRFCYVSVTVKNVTIVNIDYKLGAAESFMDKMIESIVTDIDRWLKC